MLDRQSLGITDPTRGAISVRVSFVRLRGGKSGGLLSLDLVTGRFVEASVAGARQCRRLLAALPV